MSHEIFELDSPTYGSNKPAWHNLGTVVAGQPTSADAIRLAKMNWTVGLEPVLADNGQGGFFEVDNAYLTARQDLAKDDSRRILGVVKGRYQPIQNADCFAIADDLVGESGARFETAGTLRNGRIVWLLAKLPSRITVKDDQLEKYLLLKSTHDGSGALQVMCTPVRVVCWNTLSMAVRGAKTAQSVSIRHTSNARARIDEAKRVLGLADSYFNAQAEMLDYLSGVQLPPEKTRAFLQTLIPDPAEGANKTRAVNARREIGSLYLGGQKGGNQTAVKGTAYGLLNAVVEYSDHRRTTRVGSGSVSKAESRMESVLWGSGADLKQKAVDLLLEQIELPAGTGQLPSAGPSDRPDVDSVLAGLDLGN